MVCLYADRTRFNIKLASLPGTLANRLESISDRLPEKWN
jgi:hypothetical protein